MSCDLSEVFLSNIQSGNCSAQKNPLYTNSLDALEWIPVIFLWKKENVILKSTVNCYSYTRRVTEIYYIYTNKYIYIYETGISKRVSKLKMFEGTIHDTLNTLHNKTMPMLFNFRGKNDNLLIENHLF